MNETIERLKSLVEVYESCAEGNFRPVESAKKAEALSKAIKAMELLPQIIDILDTCEKTTEYSGYAKTCRILIQKAKGVLGDG
jgi:hypothetical protein